MKGLYITYTCMYLVLLVEKLFLHEAEKKCDVYRSIDRRPSVSIECGKLECLGVGSKLEVQRPICAVQSAAENLQKDSAAC